MKVPAMVKKNCAACRPLVATNRLTPPKAGTDAHKGRSMIHRASPGADRWKIRSKTFPGIAAAMADQCGQPERDGIAQMEVK